MNTAPELNLSENLWIQQKSANGKINPANTQELEQIAMEKWEKLPADRCKKLVDGYKKHLEAVIVAKNCATNYLGRVILMLSRSYLVSSLKSLHVL